MQGGGAPLVSTPGLVLCELGCGVRCKLGTREWIFQGPQKYQICHPAWSQKHLGWDLMTHLKKEKD